MHDLTSTMFYKAKFTITACEPEKSDLLWKTIMDIRWWITRKLNRNGKTIVDPDIARWTSFKGGCKLYDQTNNNAFYAESASHTDVKSGKRSWACMMIEKPEPTAGCASREWITEIGYQAITPEEAEISYVVTYNDAAGFIGPCMPEPGISVPNVIKNLLTDTSIRCTNGSTHLKLAPTPLTVGSYPAFEQLLLDPEREVPIIYISPSGQKDDTGTADTLIDVEKVAETVAANALVYYSKDPAFSNEMCYLGKSDYTCSGGALRIYMPHINYRSRSDHYRHRFITAEEIKENGADHIYNILRRAIAQDVHFYEKLFRLTNCKNLIAEEQHRKKIEEVRAKSEHSVDEAIQEFLSESERCQALEERIGELQDKLDDAKRDEGGLRNQLQALKDVYKMNKELGRSLDEIRNMKEIPDTPSKVAQYYQMVYPDKIAFTERGLKSMETAEKKCSMLWEIFYLMTHDLYDLLHTTPATAYDQFQEDTGWECSRGEGCMTRKDKKLMRNYVDTYNGQEINVEPHIKRGNKDTDPNSVRIHFAYDPSVAPQIIISHCGKHLDNYTTQKRH